LHYTCCTGVAERRPLLPSDGVFPGRHDLHRRCGDAGVGVLGEPAHQLARVGVQQHLSRDLRGGGAEVSMMTREHLTAHQVSEQASCIGASGIPKPV